jgi:hypothetical protein
MSQMTGASLTRLHDLDRLTRLLVRLAKMCKPLAERTLRAPSGPA